ncbi:uncharacterized protein LOC129737765 [Uranotaenia lowii]|uniref:uncharacterized protein LOC129737765 n=1 Tax=Uranotaenia lowii TaxID=190385 RepID=UPI00247AF9BF|nr:uncharacterized protein LOC129737765 [Uranotaenia lowii]
MDANFLGLNYHLMLGTCSAHSRQGAALAIKTGTPFQRLPVNSDIQAVAIRIFSPVEMTLVSIYLPPSEIDVLDKLEDLLDTLPKPLMILGDFNAHHASWGSRILSRSTIAANRANWEEYVELVNENIIPEEPLTVEEFTERLIEAAEKTIPRTIIWNRINRLRGKRHSNNIIFHLPTGATSDGSTVCNVLADEYEKRFSDSNYPKRLQNSTRSAFTIDRPYLDEKYNSAFSLLELEWALERRGGNSTGHDNIGYPLLQKLPGSSKRALLDLYNRIWTSGQFPPSWRHGIVIRIPKPDGNRSQPDGYRPITLLSCMGKVFERLINRRLVTELEATGRLDHRQHAFRAGHGVDTYFAQLETLTNINDSEHIELVSLDISKAFDTTNRTHILRTLRGWKIRGRMLNMLCSYLEHRTFKVSANGSLSTLRSAENGVPQGSTLSVTLFLVAMQPLFDVIPSNVETLLYADDVLLISKGTDRVKLRQELRAAANAVVKWTTSVGFTLSAPKSKLMHICRIKHRKRGRPIKLNREPIPQVRTMRVLGVLLDSKMNFRQHFRQVKQSCENRVRILKILGYQLRRGHRKTLLQVGNSLVTSKLLYGVGLTSCNIDLMDEMLTPTYNEVVRQSSGAFRSSPVESLLAESGCLPFRLLLVQRLAQLGIRLVEKNIDQSALTIDRSENVFQSTANTPVPSVYPLSRLTDRLWNHDLPKIDITLKRSIKAGSSQRIVLPKFNEFIASKYSTFKHIYTDGSKDNNNTGAGVYLPPRKISRNLPSDCSIFSAEAYALNVAAQESDINESTLILTDSASCLDALYKGASRHPWIQSLENHARERNLIFTWVPGHAGIPGNEEADKCANIARNSTPPSADRRIPAQDAIQNVKTSIWSTWEHKWHSNQSFLRQHKYMPIKPKDRKCSSDQRVLTRLRIGHKRLTHAHLFDRSSPPICQFCGVQTTVQHILIDCRGYEEAPKIESFNLTLKAMQIIEPSLSQ